MTDDEHPALLLQGVSVGYGGRPVVQDFDLTVEQGEVRLVLGCNGSGKTTVVRGVLGLADVPDGNIQVFGHPGSSSAAKATVGYVPQRHTVGGPIPSTVYEVVSSGALTRRGWFGRLRREDREAVDEAIDDVGLGDLARRPVGALSGGQQRRVLIARALASRPRLLIMDEPTAGVDAESQAGLVDTLARLRESHLTLVIVSHDLGPLEPIATHAVTLSHGRKQYDGPATVSVGMVQPRPDDGCDTQACLGDDAELAG